VHLAADAAARSPAPDPLTSLTAPGAPVTTWVEHDLLPTLPTEAVGLLRLLAGLGLVTADLVSSLPDSPDPAAYDLLVRTGLVVPHPRDQLLGRPGHHVVPLVAAVVAQEPEPETWRHLARWYADRQLWFAAVDAHARVGEAQAADRLLAAHGPAMVASGDAAGVVDLLAGRGRSTGDLERGVLLTLAAAHATLGDGETALGLLAPLTRHAEEQGWDVRLATDVAAVQFSQGHLPAALATLDRVAASSLPDHADGIRWRATRVNVASMLGADDEAAALASETLTLARDAGADGDLVAAHLAMAKVSAGSRKSAHLSHALEASRRCGDVVQLARILGNQTYTMLAGVRCDEAVHVGREAVRATELVRPMGALTAALHNLAEGLSRTGEYAEARWHLRRAIAVSHRIGPNRAASSLAGLGDVHRALELRQQGRAAYEEAITLARASQERQVLVPALAGLARLVVDEDPVEARARAEEAVALATAGLAPYAWVALGWVELAEGDAMRATELAADAATRAREQRALDLLAEALELTAAATDDADAARAALLEGRAIWVGGGAGPDADRVAVLLGRLEGADRDTRRQGREAARRLQRLGVTRLHGRPLAEDPVGKEIEVQLLGRFEVAVGGHPVPLPAWKSRQARTLVKVLAARRGRPVSRGELCEILWPDADPVKTSHRLSVLLTTVRGVLDPEKTWPADRYLSSDNRGVWLDLRRVGVDADELLADADHGAALLEGGAVEEARQVLAEVDQRYRGEVFEDEPYEEWVTEDWAVALKEEARAAWVRSLRHLATAATRQGRSNDASALLVRLLSVDPYDERVHRGLVRTLVRAGRHGEARRAFDRWTEAMVAVDAPAPDTDELVPRPRPPDR
jgi:DNA-binding SARP family transcriptional activator